MRSSKFGKSLTRLERKSGKSHCGMKAMNLQCVGNREKSAIGTV